MNNILKTVTLLLFTLSTVNTEAQKGRRGENQSQPQMNQQPRPQQVQPRPQMSQPRPQQTQPRQQIQPRPQINQQPGPPINQPRPQVVHQPRPQINQPRPEQTQPRSPIAHTRPQINQPPRPQQTQPAPRVDQPRAQINHPEVNSRPAVRTNPVNRNDPNRYVNRQGYRPQGWAATRRPYTRPPVVYGGRRYYTYHSYHPHPYVAYNYGPRWHPAGFFLSALIGSAIIINYENRAYRYDDGVFYEPYDNGYRVIPAPAGAYIPSLPPGYEEVYVDDQNYYYYGGAFFVLNGNNYQVVQAPAGAVIYNLPEGAVASQVGDYTFVQYNGVYYEPVEVNGRDGYEVTEMQPDNG